MPFEVALDGRPKPLDRGLAELPLADAFDERSHEGGGVSSTPGEGLIEPLPGDPAEQVTLLAVAPFLVKRVHVVRLLLLRKDWEIISSTGHLNPAGNGGRDLLFVYSIRLRGGPTSSPARGVVTAIDEGGMRPTYG